MYSIARLCSIVITAETLSTCTAMLVMFYTFFYDMSDRFISATIVMKQLSRTLLNVRGFAIVASRSAITLFRQGTQSNVVWDKVKEDRE
jgi:hypothetical protein